MYETLYLNRMYIIVTKIPGTINFPQVPFVRQGMISKLRDSFVKLAREKESDLLGHPKSVELPND